MMTRNIHPDALPETYLDVYRLLFDTVWQFQRKHGGEIVELFSEANLYFMKAYDSHNRDVSLFSTWVRNKVWFGLMEFRRNQIKHAHRSPAVMDPADLIQMPTPEEASADHLTNLLERLGDEAQTIVKLVLDSPPEIAEILVDAVNQPATTRKAIRKYLKTLGWSVVQIKESFREIRAALS